MATTVYYANDGSQNGSEWTNPANAWNGSTGNYAEYDLPLNIDTDSTNYLLATAYDSVPSSGDIIRTVEIAIYTDIEDNTNNDIYVVPVFSGTTDGSQYDTNSSTTAEWHYIDITDDANAPSTWSWSDIQDLDFKAYGRNGTLSKSRWVRVHTMGVRVTYGATTYNESISDSFDLSESISVNGGVPNVNIPNYPYTEDFFDDGSIGNWWSNDNTTNSESGTTLTTSIPDTSDASHATFNMVGIYQTIASGEDFDIKVYIDSYDANLIPGIVIKDTSNDYYYILLRNGSRYYRYSGGSGSGTNVNAGDYLRFVRSGSSITAYSSTDGETWDQGGSVNITSGQVRFYLTGDNNGTGDLDVSWNWFLNTDTSSNPQPSFILNGDTSNLTPSGDIDLDTLTPPSGSFTIYNRGDVGETWDTKLNWTATISGGSTWVSVSPSSGTESSSASSGTEVIITYTLPQFSGVYYDNIVVSDSNADNSPQIIDITFTAEASASNEVYDDSISDGIELSDNSTVIITIPQSISDGIELSDTSTAITIFNATNMDGIELSDDTTESVSVVSLVEDGITLSDESTITKTVNQTITDGIELSDEIITITSFNVSNTDGIELSDTITESVSVVSLVEDGIELSDTTTEIAIFNATNIDGITLSDESTITKTVNQTITDGVELSDSNEITLLANPSITDGIELSDFNVVEMIIPISLEDGIETSDNSIVSITMNETSTDGIELSDEVSPIISMVNSVDDGIIFYESILNSQSGNFTLLDGIEFSDIDINTIDYISDISDGLQISDTSTAETTINVSIDDNIVFSDISTFGAFFDYSLLDGIVFSDEQSNIGNFEVIASDVFELSDESIVSVNFETTLTDTFIVNDTSEIIVSVNVTVSDGTVLSDTTIGAVSFNASIEDSLDITDIANAAVSYITEITDGITLSDENEYLATIDFTVTDGITLNDIQTTTITFTTNVSDNLSFSDISNIEFITAKLTLYSDKVVMNYKSKVGKIYMNSLGYRYKYLSKDYKYYFEGKKELFSLENSE